MSLSKPFRSPIRTRVGALAVVALFAVTPAIANEQPQAGEKWSAWLEFGGAYNNRDASRGEATLFAPLLQGSHDIFFADWRAKLFEDDIKEGNFALGWRQMRARGWNIGAWGGLDVRSTQYNNTFWLLAGGVEALHPNWDLRANAYLPISSPQQAQGLAEVLLDGNEIYMVGGEEVPLYGIDAEIGARIPLELLVPDLEQHELRIFAGGFYFDHDESFEEIAGPKARAEWRINDVVAGWTGSRLTIESEFSYDEVRKSRYEVGARLRLPFGAPKLASATQTSPSLTPQEQRMVEGLERDTDVVTAQSERESVEDAATNVDFDQVAYASTGSGLTRAIGRGGNTLIIVSGGKGQITGGKTLNRRQTLVGGAGTITVRGKRTGTATGFTSPGSRPTISEATNAILTVANNTHIAHVNLRGNGGATLATNDGIIGGSNQRVVIEGIVMSGIGDNGIRFGSNNNVTLNNVILRNVDDEGIDVVDNNTIVINGANVRNVNGSAIQLGNGNALTIASTSINNAGGDGIELGDNNTFSISSTTIANVGNIGINANTGNSARITGVTVSTTTSAGIRFNNNNSVVVTNTSVANTGADGILVESNNRVTIADVLVRNIGNQALDFHANNVITITRTKFAGNIGIDAIEFDGTGNRVVKSSGNINNTTAIGGRLCDTLAGADFSGTISFVDGTRLRDDVAPCN